MCVDVSLSELHTYHRIEGHIDKSKRRTICMLCGYCWWRCNSNATIESEDLCFSFVGSRML